MGKSLNGKELGKGLCQRKDGRYQARFTNRFGKVQTLYGATLNEVRKKLSEAQYVDDKALNVVSDNVTLDEWFEIWMKDCKKNCLDTTIESYKTHYNRIKEALGWRKLTSLNLIILQQAFNELKTDYSRSKSKRILIDMLDKAVSADLLTKNVAREINTVVSKDKKKEKRVLTIPEQEKFLKAAAGRYYFPLFLLALETGLRVGELMGLKWSDINFSKRTLKISRSLCYFSKNGKYVFEWHEPKTPNSYRSIPLTQNAIKSLSMQKCQMESVLRKHPEVEDQYKDLVFLTKNGKPTQGSILGECTDSIMRKLQFENYEFERVTMHTFRHTFATRMIENGMPPKTLQKLLGHAKLQLTMDLYCHVTEDTIMSSLDFMERTTNQSIVQSVQNKRVS